MLLIANRYVGYTVAQIGTDLRLRLLRPRWEFFLHQPGRRAHRPVPGAVGALGSVREAALCDTLGRLRGELTILAVSHQTGLAAIAGRVMRLEDGVVTPRRPVPGCTAEGSRALRRPSGRGAMRCPTILSRLTHDRTRGG